MEYMSLKGIDELNHNKSASQADPALAWCEGNLGGRVGAPLQNFVRETGEPPFTFRVDT